MADAYSGTATHTGGTYEITALSNALREVYSEEIYAKAMPILKFEEFATKRLELGVQPGKTIRIMKAEDIARGGALVEDEPLEKNLMYMSYTDVDMVEYGNALGLSEFLVQASFFDQLDYASMLLGRDYAQTLDLILRNTVCPVGISTDSTAAASFVYGNAAGSSPSDVTPNDFFSADLIREAVLKLQTYNAPKFNGDYYVCFTHPHCLRYLRKDPDWVNASYYGGPTRIFTGEVGRFEDVRFVASTIMPQGATATWDATVGQYIPGYDTFLINSGTTGAVNLYKSCIFGEDTYALGISLPVELRDDGVSNFGRFHGLAWYSIYGSGILNNRHNCLVYTA
jgi:N4-gp56 family major capsid protein